MLMIQYRERERERGGGEGGRRWINFLAMINNKICLVII